MAASRASLPDHAASAPAGARGRIPRLGAPLLLGVVVLAAAACSGSTGTATSTATAASPSAAASSSTDTGQPPAPPSGQAPNGQAPGGNTTSASVTYAGAVTQAGGSVSKTGETITASMQDESGVLASGSADVSLANVAVTTTGNSSSTDNSSFYGLNAGVLATDGSKIAMTGGSITTSGTGANGAFATGSTSSLALDGVTITATGAAAHGVMATQGATITAKDLTVSTASTNAAPIATDRGGGTITVTRGTYTAAGKDSPALYSTGVLNVTGATLKATGAEAAVIEGSNSITLTDSSLSTTLAGKWGVMIYQSMSGDASGANGQFTMTGGSLTDTDPTGPLFYVTNSTGTITLKGVTVSDASGVLLSAAAGSWGTSGSNGGHATLVADGQTLSGNVMADAASSATVKLTNGSTLSGTLFNASISLDPSSAWTVTGDSTLVSLSGAVISGSSITNITGNGHTVTYDAANSTNSALNSGTYTLAGGGTLKPAD